MFDNASISVRLETLGARIRVPDYLKFNPKHQEQIARSVASLEELFDEVEKAN
jgi:hypothetical protein